MDLLSKVEGIEFATPARPDECCGFGGTFSVFEEAVSTKMGYDFETGTDPERLTGRQRSWWLDTIASDQDLARDYVKSHGRTVKDVMTPDVISVTETTELAEIAMLLETKRIKRVPVMRDGRLVGIVSRANLVRALAAAKNEPATNADSDDRTIRQKLLSELKGQEWFKMQDWSKIWAADILVRDRVVHFCSPTTNPKKRGGRCASPQRTSQGYGASKSTSSRPP
jgi:CBS domain/Cysteine-rich domain